MQALGNGDRQENYCGTTQAARLLGLSVGTIQSLVEKNELQAWKTQGGHRRISLPSILQYQHRQNKSLGTTIKRDEKLRILAVDDDPLAGKVLKDFVAHSDMPLECIIMTSGIRALIDITSIQPDVLIVDLKMPNVDGFELLRTLRGHNLFSKMSFLAVSVSTQEEINAKGGLPDGVIFMPKPLSPSWLSGFVAAISTTRQAEAYRIVHPSTSGFLAPSA